ncbi:MAG TPA: Uma2 family endonuclease [Pyrinomonadaceae bacterium]|nr:Uma2 family endonuclease [Pyrinomonadaceae bacterium]
MATKIEPLMTITDLEAMPDDGNRYEVIEGELFVSCAPGLTHQQISGNIQYLIRSYLEENAIGFVIATPGLILTELSGVIPDMVFFRHERSQEIISGERLTGAPDIVVEILSPGAENIRRDRIAKRQLYARHGVAEYWMVDPEKRALEVYRLQSGSLELVATLKDEDELNSPFLPGFSCATATIFRK